MKLKWYKIKLFRYIAHLFGIRFWRKDDIKNIEKEANEMYNYFNFGA